MSPWISLTFSRPATVSWVRAKKAGSVSTLTTIPASWARCAVRPPVPLPTSKTRSSRVNSAVRTIKSSRLRSMRKFWPSLLFGRMPRCSKRLRRKESVCRGSMKQCPLFCFAAILHPQLQKLENIFCDQVRFQVNRRADGLESECSIGQRVRDERCAESIHCHIDHGQADAIRSHGSFGNHLAGQVTWAGEPNQFPVRLPDAVCDAAHAVDMALYEMPAEAILQTERSFQINAVPGL